MSLQTICHKVIGRMDVLVLPLVAMLVHSAIVRADEPVDFNRDIRPILSDNCYFCHGPDEENRAADLRFDIEEEARDSIESGEFIDRIFSDDPDYIMPKPQSHLSLSDRDKELLERWVESGAQYEQHWAFAPLPKKVAPPKFKDATWVRQPIDQFVLSRLEEAKLSPAKEADPLRWLRRATFDLTGLPPKRADIDSFQKKMQSVTDARQRDAVYENEVARLLADSSFGEHMAVSWLDAARYADSYGYQSDKLNTQWPYRDWLVRAFNENLPYDQFLTWQLAGDLFDSPTTDQKLATAFNRIHRLNNEGGAIFEEWRLENVADRVHTYGSAVLGLTFECCRCHDHKYDPISARDYYSLSAFFNSIDENGLYDRTAKVPSPTMLLPTDAQAAALLEAAETVKQKHFDLAQQRQRVADKFEAGGYEKEVEAAKEMANEMVEENTVLPGLLLQLTLDEPFDGDRLVDGKKQKEIWHPSTSDRNWSKERPLVDASDCPFPRPVGSKGDRKAMALDGEVGLTTKSIPPFDRWTPFSVVINLRETERIEEASVIAHHTRGTDAGFNGWDLTIEDGHLQSRMYRVWPGNAMGVRTVEPIPFDKWHLLVATYDGRSKATGLKIFLDGKELATTVLRDNKIKSANVKVDHGGQFTIGQRFRDRGLAGGLIADVRLYERNITQAEINFLTTGEPLVADAEYIAAVVDVDAMAAEAAALKAEEAFVMAEEVMNEIPVMIETAQPRPAHVLARGAYDAATNESTLVKRATPQKIGPPMPVADGKIADRLDLAQWTVDPAHPLTGRVVANRLWANFFGHGLVRTPENFGLQGELPTHPKLLDFLARDFIDSGWDVKRFCKNVVLSATYRQDSAADKSTFEADPENRMLARGSAYRLSAEQIRDMVLSASGLMNGEAGGPPVSPYQPGGDLWRESNSMSPAYEQAVGKALYRRSLYSVWKRTAPLPNMMAFDASTREVCTISRARTNTPLQALVLLNDVQFVEAARFMAQQLLAQENAIEKNIVASFIRLTGRAPDEKEANLLAELYFDEKYYYQENVDEAKALVILGESEHDDAANVVELAAFTTTIQAIMNLDATLTRR